MLATMQQFVDRTTDGKQINYDVQYDNIICCFSVVVVCRELGGCCVVENQCVGSHVDIGSGLTQILPRATLSSSECHNNNSM